jgi:hypothetical protein
MTPAAGIIEILVDKGEGALAPTTDSWPIYEGQFPETTQQCLMVKDTGGRPPEVKVAIDYPSVQILVRGGQEDYMAVREKAQDVFVALHAIDSSPTPYPELTSCLGLAPVFLGYDANKRPVWAVNFNCIVSKSPEGYRDQ